MLLLKCIVCNAVAMGNVRLFCATLVLAFLVQCNMGVRFEATVTNGRELLAAFIQMTYDATKAGNGSSADRYITSFKP